jgi:leucine-rich repeat protein SHOC2
MIKILSQTLINLEIYDSTISYLPNEIGNFMKLKTLKLSNTGLIVLPDSIGDLSSLQFLLLSNNKLTYLPKTMKNLRLLEQLILTNNPDLHSIESINGLPLLGILQTQHCPIQSLPRDLPQLTSIHMPNNNLENLTNI